MRIKEYSYFVRVEPSPWSKRTYIKYRCHTVEEALQKAESDAKRTGKPFYVYDKQNKLVQKFDIPKIAV